MIFLQISAYSVRRGDIDLSFDVHFSPPQLTETPERSRRNRESGGGGGFDVMLTPAPLKAVLRHPVLEMTYL